VWVRDQRLITYREALERLHTLTVTWGTELRTARFDPDHAAADYAELAAAFTELLAEFGSSIVQIDLLGYHAQEVGDAYWDAAEIVARLLGDNGATTEEWDLAARLLMYPYNRLQVAARKDLGIGRRNPKVNSAGTPFGLVRPVPD
jgi:hypothetical protein